MITQTDLPKNEACCLTAGVSGGWAERGFCLGAGKNPKPENCLKNAPTPHRQLHALLGNLSERQTRLPQKANTINLI